jgi:hypothetical protein
LTTNTPQNKETPIVNDTNNNNRILESCFHLFVPLLFALYLPELLCHEWHSLLQRLDRLGLVMSCTRRYGNDICCVKRRRHATLYPHDALFISFILFSIFHDAPFCFLQEKVEEDRFMRELEKSFFEKKKKEMADKMNAEKTKEYQEKIAPAMAEIEVALKKSNDKISHAGLETIARWKLGLKE